MDPTQFIANSNMMLVSFWEVIAKIGNPVLFWTLIVSATGHLVYTFGSAVIARNLANDMDFNKYFYLTACLTAWFSIVFHTTYRTLLIMYPRSNRVWIVPSIILVVQIVIQSTGLWFWYNNWTTNYFATDTPEFYWNAIATMIFVCGVDSCFFVLAQYKIITTLREVSNTPVSALHVVKMLLRTMCYSSAVIMEFSFARGEILLLKYISFAIGQYFYNIGTGKEKRSGVIGLLEEGSFVYQAQNLMITVLLADSHHVTQIVKYYSVSSSQRSGTGSQSASARSTRVQSMSSPDGKASHV
ncbi:hypothetical protein DFJ73DRAFT_879646 [Zopfochytrium polystomum]|nr:hypothetical protein DFJ73DRAFT_879646 [Zopfochytrium polystomum]